MDNQLSCLRSTLAALVLDLSAASDTIDHAILLRRLEGIDLHLFESYGTWSAGGRVWGGGNSENVLTLNLKKIKW